MRFVAACLALAAGMPSADVAAQEWCPAPAGRWITVANRVRLHVVDWGRTGEPIIFLSGILGSAHIFDDFAPLFAETHRAIAITRRGIPPSDKSPSGYTAAVLTSDIIAVMDSLGISGAHLVGWSFGGNEAALLAVASPKRVLSLTLLDSYDRRARRPRTADSPRPLPPPSFLSFDSLSPLSLQWRDQRLGDRPPPLSFVCTSNKFTAEGRYIGPVVSPPVRDSIAGAMREGMPGLPYSQVRQPVLALFAVPRGIGDRFPTYATMSAQDRQLADAMFRAATADMGAARDRVRREMPHARLIEVPGAAHALFHLILKPCSSRCGSS